MRAAAFFKLQALSNVFHHRETWNIDSVAGLHLVVRRGVAKLDDLLVADGKYLALLVG